MEVSHIFKYAAWGVFFALLIREVFTFLNGKSSEGWRRHKATVVDIKVDVKTIDSSSGDEGYIANKTQYNMPFVRYEYQCSGIKYLSKRMQLNNNWSSDYADSSSAVVGINPGSEIVIYVNPKKPKQSVLTRGYRGNNLTDLACVFLVALGVELFS